MMLGPARVDGVRPLRPRVKLALATEILATYGRMRWRLRREGLPAALAAARREAGSGPGPAPGGDRTRSAAVTGIRLGRSVSRTLAPMPADSRCLMRSLVLTAVLARRGIDAELVIGVRPGARLEAHAWVEHAGTPLLPGGADYGVLLRA